MEKEEYCTKNEMIGEVMGTAILIGSFLLIIGAFWIEKSNQKSAQTNDNTIKNLMSNSGENIKSYSYGEGLTEKKDIAIDIDHNMLHIFVFNYYGKEPRHRIKYIGFISKCELVFDNETVFLLTEQAKHSEQLSECIAWSVGAIIGGLSGEKTAKKGKLEEAKIIIYYNDPLLPTDTLVFKIEINVKPEYIEKCATEFYATLLACIEKIKEMEDAVQQWKKKILNFVHSVQKRSRRQLWYVSIADETSPPIIYIEVLKSPPPSGRGLFHFSSNKTISFRLLKKYSNNSLLSAPSLLVYSGNLPTTSCETGRLVGYA